MGSPGLYNGQVRRGIGRHSSPNLDAEAKAKIKIGPRECEVRHKGIQEFIS
jgi:hypothetical protein